MNSILDLLQRHDSEVYQKFPSMFKVDRHTITHHGLHLAQPPLAVLWMEDPHPWFYTVHPNASIRARGELFLPYFANNAHLIPNILQSDVDLKNPATRQR